MVFLKLAVELVQQLLVLDDIEVLFAVLALDELQDEHFGVVEIAFEGEEGHIFAVVVFDVVEELEGHFVSVFVVQRDEVFVHRILLNSFGMDTL